MSWTRLRLAVVLGSLLLLLTLNGAAWWVVGRMSDTASQSAKGSLQSTADIIAATVNRQLLQVDGALASIGRLTNIVSGTAPVQSGGGQSGELNDEAASRLLRGLSFQTFSFRNLLLARPDGTVWASGRPILRNQTLPVASAEMEEVDRLGAAVLTGPYRNPLTGDWDVLMLRKIYMRGPGKLIAVAEVPLPMLETLLTDAGGATGLRIMLQRRDGRLLVSHPYREPAAAQALPAELQNGGGNAGATEMLVAQRATLFHDLLVLVTAHRRVAMAEWYMQRRTIMTALVLVDLLMSALAATLSLALRQHDRLEAERAQARRTMAEAIEAISIGFVMWDQDDRLAMCNARYRSMYPSNMEAIQTGATFEHIIRSGVANGQHPEAEGQVEEFVGAMLAWHQGGSGNVERRQPDGRWLLANDCPMPSGGYVGVRIDITALKQAQADLEIANARTREAMAEVQQQNAALEDRDRALHTQNLRFEAALSHMSHGLLMVDAAQKVIVYNQRFVELFGLVSVAIAPGATTREMFSCIRASPFGVNAAERAYAKQTELGAEQGSGIFVIESEDGRALRVAQRPMADGGWVAIYEDVTEQQSAERRIRFLAHHDELTKLPNRTMLHAEMVAALQDRDHGGRNVALLYLDLDKFKNVNDTLGHPTGDALLVAVAQRLRHCLQSRDIVARLGGDEFAVVCRSQDMPSGAIELGRRIIETLSAPYDLSGRLVTIGASVGIAVAPPDDDDADALLKNADMALYQAKEAGRGMYCLFEPAMETRLQVRLQMERELVLALAHDELIVFYQPIYDLRRDEIIGFEALLRWRHPSRGFVSPAEFIVLAEETGVINEIGAWVLQTACADGATLPPHVKIAVNLSPVQLKSEAIVEIVRAALESSGLSPARLELEITESALLQDNEKTVAILFQLRALGLSIALDDFGTGYSSLSYLRTFPFDKLKIDQSFVREMVSRTDCAAIVCSAVDLADRLGMNTTAEGVETAEQLARVRETGCSEAQGYLLGRPNTIAHAHAYFTTQAIAS
jgi:diguanylate cyclase (GGDEF)-like protein